MEFDLADGILASVFGQMEVADAVASENNVEAGASVPTSPSGKAGDAESDQATQERARPYFRHVYIPLPTKRFRYMSHAEISVVVRQSLQQLQTKNPMDDDFYYQVTMARSGGPWKGVGLPSIETTGPLMANRFRNPDGSPILPEGTLGRVALSSVRKPRTLLQLTGDSKGTTTAPDADAAVIGGPRRFMFAKFSLPYIIEEGIRCIMDVEDVDNILLAFPSANAEEAAQQAALHQQRLRLGRRLLEHLGFGDLVDPDGNPLPDRLLETPDEGHILFKYAAQAKGRTLVLRALMCLRTDQVYLVVRAMMSRLSLFALPEDVVPIDMQMGVVIDRHLEKWLPPQIIGLMQIVLSGLGPVPLVEIARSLVGSVIILSFCKRGHELRNHPMAPPIDVATWLELFGVIWGQLSVNFAQVITPSSDGMRVAPDATRWRILADLSSHASPEQLAMIPREGDLWVHVETAVPVHPPAAYFASLATSIYRPPPPPGIPGPAQ